MKNSGFSIFILGILITSLSATSAAADSPMKNAFCTNRRECFVMVQSHSVAIGGVYTAHE